MTKLTYRITSTGDNKWHETTAKTARGAKAAASRYYQEAYGAALKIGVARDENSTDTVATKPYAQPWNSHDERGL